MSLRKLKELVKKRAKGLCEYCKSPSNISSHSFAMEHIIPEVKGGATTEDNLAFSCQGCNNRKYDKTSALDPKTQEIVNLFHPRLQEWEDNFVWSEDLLKILGETASGRATIERLQMNREELQNLRDMLRKVGDHPSQKK